jgi:ligand-binding sensor domain-containing protein/signal transduction histidine kinase
MTGKLFIVLFLFFRIELVFSLDPNKPITHYGHDVWNENNGLNAFVINAIAQTPDGYLWLGTDEGLYRFDGYQFTLFNTHTNPEFRENDVSSLVTNKSGVLWIGTRGGGLLRYSNNHFSLLTKQNGLPSDTILSLFVDHADVLWIGTMRQGICKLEQGQFTKYPSRVRIGFNDIHSISEDRSNNLWISVGRAATIGPQRDSINVLSLGEKGLVRTVLMYRDSILYVGKTEGLYVRHSDVLASVPYEGTNIGASVAALLEDRDGNLWIGTEGVGLFRSTRGKLSKFTIQDGLPSDRIISLFEDKDGNLWIGTRGGGLVRLRNRSIITYTTDNGLSSDFISSVREDSKGTMWIGTRTAGVNLLRHGQITKIYNVNSGLLDNQVRALCEDNGGGVWLGTMKSVEYLSDGSGGNAMRIRHVLDSTNSTLTNIRSIYCDNRGTIWVGGYGGGLVRYENNAWQPVTFRSTLPTNNFIRVITEDRTGAMWVGTQAGVNQIVGDSPVRFYSTADGLSSNEIFSLYTDEEDALWIGTYGGGLNRLKDGKIQAVRKENGLFDDIIFAILDDDRGNFWMSCNRGIFRVRKQDLRDFFDKTLSTVHSISYGVEDGMKSAECNGGSQPSAWKTKEGLLIFPTVKGVVILDPNTIDSVSSSLQTTIEEVTTESDTIVPSDGLELPLGDRKIEIQYTAVTFVGAERIQFRFQLEGYDKAWIEAGTRRKAYYTNLAPGEYTFKVVSSTREGTWNPVPAAMTFVIPPFVWETTWFRLTAGGSVLLIIFGVTRYVSTRALKQRLKNLEAQQALERERSRISKDMHDEVGASLSQIAILSELLGKNIESREAALSYLKKISATAHDVVGSLDEIVWFINPKHDTLESLMFYLREYFANYFESVEIHCRFEYPDSFPSAKLSPDIRRNIFLVAKEAANNIIKHAGASEVLVRVSCENETLSITIEDNGKGVPSRNLSAFGNGLKNMQRRMEEIGGTFVIATSDGNGTRISFTAAIQA